MSKNKVDLIIQEIQNLSPEDRSTLFQQLPEMFSFLKKLFKSVENDVSKVAEPQVSPYSLEAIDSLKGIGEGLWVEDAQDFVSDLRASR